MEIFNPENTFTYIVIQFHEINVDIMKFDDFLFTLPHMHKIDFMLSPINRLKATWMNLPFKDTCDTLKYKLL